MGFACNFSRPGWWRGRGAVEVRESGPAASRESSSPAAQQPPVSGCAAFRHQRQPCAAQSAAAPPCLAPPSWPYLPGCAVVCGLWSVVSSKSWTSQGRKLEFFPALDPQTRERFRSPTRRSPTGDQSPIIGNAHSRLFTSLKLRQDLQIPARGQRFAPTTFSLHLAFPDPDRGILPTASDNTDTQHPSLPRRPALLPSPRDITSTVHRTL